MDPRQETTSNKPTGTSGDEEREPVKETEPADETIEVDRSIILNPSRLVDEIVEGLFLGQENTLRNIKFLQDAGITAVLSVHDEDLKPELRRNAIAAGIGKLVQIKLVDGPGNDMRQFERAVNQLQSWMDAGERVLVHCQAGRSRSPAVVVGYLMKARNIEYTDAIVVVAGKREINIQKAVGRLAYNLELEMDFEAPE